MAEPVLGLEDVTLADQNGCDSVSQSMQGDVAVPGAMGKVGEPVAGAARRQPGVVLGAAGEQPRSEPGRPSTRHQGAP